MFNGFTQGTLGFFNGIKRQNSKTYFNEIKDEYNLQVKYPLIELYNCLIGPLMAFEDQIDYRLSKCISSPYADARFCRSSPIKEYMYLRFKLIRDRTGDIPGFFFDASPDLVRFGVKLYNTSSGGMQKIRDHIWANQTGFRKTAVKIENRTGLSVEGKPFKRDHYPDCKAPVKTWLNFRDINVFCPLKDRDEFFKPELAKTINGTFAFLRPLFTLMKVSLDT
jgi:uncharacterized protein (DUF2461 family)